LAKVALRQLMVTLARTTHSQKGIHLLANFLPLSQLAMPRAVTDRFTRAHQASAKPSGSSKGKEKDTSDSAGATRNPLFNTERFGQHILKNPQIAQE
jgi:hypothetical protein